MQRRTMLGNSGNGGGALVVLPSIAGDKVQQWARSTIQRSDALAW